MRFNHTMIVFKLTDIYISHNNYHTVTNQTDLLCKKVDWFVYDRRALQDKGG